MLQLVTVGELDAILDNNLVPDTQLLGAGAKGGDPEVRRRKAQHHCASLHLCWGSSELNRRLFWQTSSKFCVIPMTVSVLT